MPHPSSPPSSSHVHPIHCINPHSDFGDGGPFRLPPLVSCVLSLPRLLSALEVPPHELSPLPTHSPWLTPSNAPPRSPSECLSDTDAFPLPYRHLVLIYELTSFLFLWNYDTSVLIEYPTNGKHDSFILISLEADSKCYSLDGMNKRILHFHLPPSTAK